MSRAKFEYGTLSDSVLRPNVEYCNNCTQLSVKLARPLAVALSQGVTTGQGGGEGPWLRQLLAVQRRGTSGAHS